MASFGIVQGTVFRSASGALYDIKGGFLLEDSITCPHCRQDAAIRLVRATGKCPRCATLI
jgi:ribosomal protein S27AE